MIAFWPCWVCAAARLLGRSSLERLRRIGVFLGYAEDDPERSRALPHFGRCSKSGDGPRAAMFTSKFASRPAVSMSNSRRLVAAEPDVILAHTTPVAAALQPESRVIPIVFVGVSDPIGSGFVASLARPGGSFTCALQSRLARRKWLAMLKEIAPRLERVALVANPKTSPYGLLYSRCGKPPRRRSQSSWCPVRPRQLLTSSTQSSHSPGSQRFSLMLPVMFLLSWDRDSCHRTSRPPESCQRGCYVFHFFVAAGGLMSYGIDQDPHIQVAAIRRSTASCGKQYNKPISGA